jgi:gas vesicle protein
MSRMDSSVSRMATGMTLTFLAGAVAGAATALLLAPKSGRKLQKDIRNALWDLREGFRDGVESRVASVSTGVRDAAEAVGDITRKIRIV